MVDDRGRHFDDLFDGKWAREGYVGLAVDAARELGEHEGSSFESSTHTRSLLPLDLMDCRLNLLIENGVVRRGGVF